MISNTNSIFSSNDVVKRGRRKCLVRPRLAGINKKIKNPFELPQLLQAIGVISDSVHGVQDFEFISCEGSRVNV